MRHNPAFAGQIAALYHLKPGDLFLDLTLGDGGHTLEALEAGARVVSVDVDPDSINRAVSFLSGKFSPVIARPEMTTAIPADFTWLIIHANFKDIGTLAKQLALPHFDGIVADLGISQNQLAVPERGFSFSFEGPLDMRLDTGLSVTAADLVNALGASELEQLFRMVDEYQAHSIAKAIVIARKKTPIKTTGELAKIVSLAKRVGPGKKINPATKTFMALRMAVNLERESLEQMLSQTPSLLEKGGTLGVISFHSGEDRIVKHFIKEKQKEGILRVVNVKPIKPDQHEIQTNPKVRSAKLRLAQKL